MRSVLKNKKGLEMGFNEIMYLILGLLVVVLFLTTFVFKTDWGAIAKSWLPHLNTTSNNDYNSINGTDEEVGIINSAFVSEYNSEKRLTDKQVELLIGEIGQNTSRILSEFARQKDSLSSGEDFGLIYGNASALSETHKNILNSHGEFFKHLPLTENEYFIIWRQTYEWKKYYKNLSDFLYKKDKSGSLILTS